MKALTDYLNPTFFENFSINEVGIKLSSDQVFKIKQKLKTLEVRSPSYSTIKLNFTNIGSRIQGDLVINSAGKQFEANSLGDDPLEIYEELKLEIDQQIANWKKDRFSPKNALPIMEHQYQSNTGGYTL